jgi:hypothetical protein
VTSQRGPFGTKSAALRPIITPAMGAVSPVGTRIILSRTLAHDADIAEPIYYQIHAVGYPTAAEQVSWKDLWSAVQR